MLFLPVTGFLTLQNHEGIQFLQYESTGGNRLGAMWLLRCAGTGLNERGPSGDASGGGGDASPRQLRKNAHGRGHCRTASIR